MEGIFIGLVTAFIIIVGFRACITYKQYKGTIYQFIYNGFFEYFFKSFIRKDLSKSTRLKNTIGEHKIIFHSVLTTDNKVALRFINIVCQSGVYVIAIEHTLGIMKGKTSDSKWIVNRDGTAYHFPNPMPLIKQQQERLSTVVDSDYIHPILTFQPEAIIANIKVSIPTCHYNDIEIALTKEIKEHNNVYSLEEIKTIVPLLMNLK